MNVMVKVHHYNDLDTIPNQLTKELMKHDLIKYWGIYGHGQNLTDYTLGELGEFVYLEGPDDVSDLSHLGYTGTLKDQLLEYTAHRQIRL